MTPPTLTDLQQAGLTELEEIFAQEDCSSVPGGCYRGVHLLRLRTSGARVVSNRLMGLIGFELIPFGVDFDARCWFFFHPRLRVGRFEPRIAPSRWRLTTAVTLNYEVSRLPGPVRSFLYDEVKPLSQSLCLGIGGINADRGQGDHFFFALTRI